MLALDHIAVSGGTLPEAVDAVEAALGVRMQPGGRHDVFGTHNALLGLANGLYLEAIAIDPGAAPPGRSRWFDLDRFAGAARLTNWICRTADLDAALAEIGEEAGQPVALSRGDLRWRMAVPQNGVLPFDNLHPALIEWQGARHPAAMLEASGCTLRRLIVTHPQADALQERLSGDLVDPRIFFAPDANPALRAEIDTPHGLRVLA